MTLTKREIIDAMPEVNGFAGQESIKMFGPVAGQDQ